MSSTLRERFCGRNGRESSFKRVYLEMFHSVPFQRELTLRNVGYSSNRSEWIKSLKIMPLGCRLTVHQEPSCRMFRRKGHFNQSVITFLRVEFASCSGGIRRKEHWKNGTFPRQQIYEVLADGVSCSGARYRLLFYSDGQIRKEKKCWMFAPGLSPYFQSIAEVRADFGDFENVRNPGKLMARMVCLHFQRN